MSKTTIETTNALRQEAWDEELFEDTVKESYFMPRFASSDGSSIVHVKTDLEAGQGDKITFGIRRRLQGSGVTSRQTLEGNEENLRDGAFSLELEEYAHAVRDAGPLDRKRPVYDMDEESRTAIKDWMVEKVDQLAFDAVQASPTKIFYGGTATSTATLTANDRTTPEILSKVKTWAKTGGDRAQTPLRPIMIGGKAYYVYLTHPDSMFDMKRNSEFTQAMREAEVRGKENPLFTGATAIWDGVVVHEHENIDIVTNWGAGSDVPGVKGVFMGQQALAWAWGSRPRTVAEEFDYGREHGFGVSMLSMTGKPVFDDDSKDYGSIAIYTARTQISDA
jgi:N4-gp56 family major capsid protein